MKVQVIYSSLSGCTKKVAESIFNGINIADKTIHDLKDGEPNVDGDIVLLGYWVDKAGPNDEMKEFMSKIKNKTVGIFCTLAYYADTAHAQQSIENGLNLVKENNTIIGTYVCNGTLSQKLMDSMRQPEAVGHHKATPQKEIRWEVMKNHPTSAECALAAERFDERIKIYSKCMDSGIDFQSIL